MIFVIGTIGYIILASFFTGVFSTIKCKDGAKFFDGKSAPSDTLAGFIWPITLSILFLCLLCRTFFRMGKLSFRIGQRPFGLFKRAGSYMANRFKKKEIKIKLPREIENSKQYRQMGKLMREYEAQLPICERESVMGADNV